MCRVNVTDFRNNISHFIELSATEDVHVTKNGEVVARFEPTEKPESFVDKVKEELGK